MNNLLELFEEIASQSEIGLETFIEERLDMILRVYEADLDESCDAIANSNLISVVKELNNYAKHK